MCNFTALNRHTFRTTTAWPRRHDGDGRGDGRGTTITTHTMKGDSKKLLEFLGEAEKTYIIPLYQRNYSWREEQCRQLFADLMAVHNEQRKHHFFGSIVSKAADFDGYERLIIDGQQRLTTISLLLIAMTNAAERGDIVAEKANKINYIRTTYLFTGCDQNVRLRPIKEDAEAYEALLCKQPDDYVKGSNVTRNYNFFYDKLKQSGLTLDALFSATLRLEIINVRLDADDDPQLIFESLNSTGLDLTEADKIRNFLLMSLDREEQETAFTNYWSRVEKATGGDPSMFVRDYMTVYTRRIAKLDDVYPAFKEFFHASGQSRMALLADMLRYARLYRAVLAQDMHDDKLNTTARHLGYLDSKVHMAFLMAFLAYAEDTGMAAEERRRVFVILECYWARRVMCNMPSNALQKTFATLHGDVLRLIGEYTQRGEPCPGTYADVLVYVLRRKEGTGELPDDTRVKKEMADRKVYKMTKEYRCFLFDGMNNGLTKETVDVVKGIDDGTLSIEHIMPQHLSAEWKAALGDDWQRIHEQYLHTFANLTLTAYNQNYSNEPFQRKWEGFRDRDGKPVVGFRDSIYNLSADLHDCKQWTETELLARQEKLYQRFIAIWPMPATKFKPIEKPTEDVSLDDDDIEFTGRSLVGFTFLGERKRMAAWADMLVEVCRVLYAEHKATIDALCAGSKHSGFRTTEGEGYQMFANDCYVLRWSSTSQKVYLLKVLLDACEVAREDLVFHLQPTTNND